VNKKIRRAFPVGELTVKKKEEGQRDFPTGGIFHTKRRKKETSGDGEKKSQKSGRGGKVPVSPTESGTHRKRGGKMPRKTRERADERRT